MRRLQCSSIRLLLYTLLAALSGGASVHHLSPYGLSCPGSSSSNFIFWAYASPRPGSQSSWAEWPVETHAHTHTVTIGFHTSHLQEPIRVARCGYCSPCSNRTSHRHLLRPHEACARQATHLPIAPAEQVNVWSRVAFPSRTGPSKPCNLSSFFLSFFSLVPLLPSRLQTLSLQHCKLRDVHDRTNHSKVWDGYITPVSSTASFPLRSLSPPLIVSVPCPNSSIHRPLDHFYPLLLTTHLSLL